MDDLLIRVIISAVLMSLMTASLGCFVVWRKMAYFGSALSHSAILGIVIGLFLGIAPFYGIIITAVIMSFLLLKLNKKDVLSEDALLGLLAHVTLALGLVLLAFVEPVYVDLNSYLFGDILAISYQDIIYMLFICVVVLLILIKYWREWLLITINEDLATVDGINIYKSQMILMLTLALVIASSIKLTGLLLITSLLIIPAASARYLSHTPLQMMLLATIFSVFASLTGLLFSYLVDVPAGPAIVLASFVLFLFSFGFYSFKSR